MSRWLMIAVSVLIFVGVGWMFRDQVQTALFDREKYVECFESEMVAEYQAMGAMSGNEIMVNLSESVLGPQLKSLANQRADAVERNGFAEELSRAEELNAEATRKWLEHYEKTKEAPDDASAALEETNVKCLKRQTLF